MFTIHTEGEGEYADYHVQIPVISYMSNIST
jgi:hypothetical protein